MQYTQEQLEEKFKDLPDDLKDALVSVENADIIQGVGHKYKLHVDQMGELADETGLVMLGLTRPGQFMDNLTKRLHISTELAKNIVREIDDQIFKPVKTSLQKVRGFEVEGPAPAPDQTAPPASTTETEANDKPTETKTDIFKEKMSGLFKHQKSETETETEESAGFIPPQTEPTPPKHDPYREPPE